MTTKHHRTSWLTGVTACALAGVALACAPALAQVPNDAVVRLTGGSMLGEALIPNLGAAWAKKIGLPATRLEPVAPDEHTLVADAAEGTRKLRMPIKFTGTSPGFEPFMRGQYDLWMTVRQPRASEIENAQKKGIPGVPTLAQLTAPGVENVVVLDAVGVIVHPANPVRKLSLQQMKDIFLGKITRWNQVGGADLPISIYAHDYTVNGTFEFLCDKLMGIANAQKCAESMPKPAGQRFVANEELADAVASNPGGIGWVGLLSKRGARPVQIATECGSVIEPSTFTVKSEEYPFSRNLNIYSHPGRPLAPAAREFLDFIVSPDGQAAIKAMGAIDLQPDVASEDYSVERLDGALNALNNGQTRIRPGDGRVFDEATQGANRYSVTFRFQPGTNAFDARGEADLTRLATLLNGPALAQSQVTLIGFTSARGDYNENRLLSRSRAELVRDRLTKEFSVKDVRAVGVGPTSPIACNTDDAPSVQLNSRVEVWIKKAASR